MEVNTIEMHCVHVWKCPNEIYYDVELTYASNKHQNNETNE